MNNPFPWAKEIINSNAVILDTETTGGAKTDQIIQLSLVDMRGAVLFDSLFKPTCEINPMAAQVHHLTKQHLRNAPSFSDTYEVIKSTMEGRTIIVYNVSFDRRMLKQTVETFKLDSSWIERLDWQCAMRAHAEYLGVKNAPKLEGGDHSALGDCMATLALLRRMAGIEAKPVEQVEQTKSTKRTPASAEGHDLLAFLAPPIELIEHLERYQAKGQLPAVIVDWLGLWQAIRGDGKTPIDGATATQWATVAQRVAVN